MYNDIAVIFLCVLAVYGAYALFREISMVFSRKNRIVAAVRVKSSTQLQSDDIVIAEKYVASHSFLDKKPVLLFDGEVPEELKKYGYDIYIKYKEKT